MIVIVLICLFVSGNLQKAQTYSSDDIITLFELKANNVKRPNYMHIRANECFRPALKCSIKEDFIIFKAKFYLSELRTISNLKIVWRVGRLQKQNRKL